MSFMTFIIFTWVLILIVFNLTNEYYQYYPYSHLHSHSLNTNLLSRGNNYSYTINNKNEEDGIIIFAYTVILAAIIVPNINQIE